MVVVHAALQPIADVQVKPRVVVVPSVLQATNADVWKQEIFGIQTVVTHVLKMMPSANANLQAVSGITIHVIHVHKTMPNVSVLRKVNIGIRTAVIIAFRI